MTKKKLKFSEIAALPDFTDSNCWKAIENGTTDNLRVHGVTKDGEFLYVKYIVCQQTPISPDYVHTLQYVVYDYKGAEQFAITHKISEIVDPAYAYELNAEKSQVLTVIVKYRVSSTKITNLIK